MPTEYKQIPGHCIDSLTDGWFLTLQQCTVSRRGVRGGDREQAKIHKRKEKDTWCKVIHRTSSFPECCQRVCFPGYNTIWLLHGWCHMKLLLSQHTFCVHHTTMDQFMVSFYLKPHETAAVSAHIVCTPYNHGPVYSITLFEATRNCCCLSTHSVYTIEPWTSLQCRFIWSHTKQLSEYTLCVYPTTMLQFTVSLYLKPHPSLRSFRPKYKTSTVSYSFVWF